jgi:photosystem II stability/assembly factor-like uncharacterized protein
VNDVVSSTQDIVYALAASPNFARDGVCFAARTSGLYRSNDGGQNWQSAYAGLELPAPLMTTAVALSPGFGVSNRLVLAGTRGGILRSADDGHTWAVTELPPPPPLVSCLALSPGFDRDGIAFAGSTNNGVFLSTDSGTTWNSWNFGLLDHNVLCLVVSPVFEQDKTLFVGTETTLYTSQNGGRSWRALVFPQDAAPVLSLAISPRFADDGILLAGTEDHGLFVSNDSGKNWSSVGVEKTPQPINAILVGTDFPESQKLLRLSGATIQFSLDAGITWQDLPVEYTREKTVTTIAAPLGLVEGAQLLIGLSESNK